MKKLTPGQILTIGAIALGAIAVGKVIYDINKIRKLTAEKEALAANEALAQSSDEATAE